MPVSLHEGRWSLVPLSQKVASIEVRLAADATVREWTFYPPGLTLSGAELRVLRSVCNMQTRRGQRYVISDGRDPVGTAGIGTALDGAAEVYYALLPEARGRGAASAAVRALQRWARAARVERLQASTLIGNTSSERMLRAAGFLPVGMAADPRDGETLRIWRSF
jgi:RimJ/RimL family protein N-acetyltransferase